jgi:hypothetical protein
MTANGLLLFLAIIGAALDWAYKKQGGVRPTDRERKYFALAVGLCAATLITLGILSGNGAALAHATVFFGNSPVRYLGAWTLARPA